MDISKVKLIIWDLDETFWRGVLTDGTTEYIEENAQLIRDITDCGVINSICSKNDYNTVKEYFSTREIWDYFVFRSINWSQKGERIKQIITEMNLRDVNVLFIDDNVLNLQEAKSVCPNINIETPDIIPTLRDYFSEAKKTDTEHKRLKQYKVLEAKKDFRASTSSNEEFLRKCNIVVNIKHNCIDNIERIYDLIQRSNQLNFTKVRSSVEELVAICEDAATEVGYVEVNDAFGDYGIVGFYAIQNGTCLHFVFSCRTLNMGIEQYVYNKLGKPSITVVGDVSSSLECETPEWINQTGNNSGDLAKDAITNDKVVFKGPCDLELVFSFIEDRSNVVKEFVYIGKNGVSIESGCHTEHIVQSLTLDDEKKTQLYDLPFGDNGMFETAIFDEDTTIVYLSLFTDPNLGLYEEKESGAIVAFGEWTNDLTDERVWQNCIDQKIYTANCKFSRGSLEDLKKRYHYLGRISPEKTVKNLEFIYSHMNPEAKLILNLGSEIEYLANTNPAYSDRHVYHQQLNSLVRAWKQGKENVYLIEMSKYVHSQKDYTNNINHFVKSVYYEIAKDIIAIISNEKIKVRKKQKSKLLRKFEKAWNLIRRRMSVAKGQTQK